MNELSLKTQMSIQKWLDIIHRYRESGLSNRQWCQENGIQLKSYYYWLSKVRKLAIEQIPRKTSAPPSLPSTVSRSASITFAEIPVKRNYSREADPITIHIGNASIEIPTDAPDPLIQSIVRTVSQC